MEDKFMNLAFELAKKAYDDNEIPVGAVIVKNNEVIGCGYNQKEKNKNPLNHAELIAIENACLNIGDWRLNGCEIYVTLKPCSMCMGAIVESRISKVYYCIEKTEQMFDIKNIELISVEKCKKECLELLQKFFQNKRNK